MTFSNPVIDAAVGFEPRKLAFELIELVPDERMCHIADVQEMPNTVVSASSTVLAAGRPLDG